MDYTQNYHLPQWEKADRIMMDDFNAAMAGIETGLSENRESARLESVRLDAKDAALGERIEAARQEAAGLSGRNLAKAQEDLQRGLFRLAYNQCAHLLEKEAPPAVDGLFLQKLDKKEIPSNSAGIEIHQDGAWCASSGPGGTVEAVQDSLEFLSNLVMVKGNLSACEKAVLTFAPTGAVCIRQLSLSGAFDSGDKEESRYRVTLDNLTRGVREMDREIGYEQGSRGGSIKIHAYAYMHGGDKYRLEIIPLNALFSGTFYYRKGLPMTLEYFDLSTDSFTGTLFHKFDAGESGHGGLVLARYDPYDKGGVLTASWGGREQQPLRVRRFTDGRGREVREAEFRFTQPIPGGSTITLKAAVPSGGDVILYNWCAALL